MSKVKQRQSEILEMLSLKKKMEVSALAEHCGVSLVTVRKDLTELEEKGLLRREQGYALLGGQHDMARRLAVNHAVKCSLAKAAAGLVEDGETVMIESGSCCILTAEEISRTKQNVTIITNSVYMADYIGAGKGVHLILLGGDYQPDSRAVVGPVAKMGADAFHVNKFFAGTDGYRTGTGFTGDNHLRADILRHMAENADQVIVVTESSKFDRQGMVPLFPPGEVTCLVTDSRLSKEVYLDLNRYQIKIITTKERE